MTSFAYSGLISKNDESSTTPATRAYMSNGRDSSCGTSSASDPRYAGGRASAIGGASRQCCGKYDRYARAASMAALSSGTSRSPLPDTSQCMRAPPISSSVTFSPMTSSAMRGEPRYIEALCSTMNTTSQSEGMYAPPAALGPNRQQTCGTRPDAFTWLWKILPAPRRPGNIST